MLKRTHHYSPKMNFGYHKRGTSQQASSGSRKTPYRVMCSNAQTRSISAAELDGSKRNESGLEGATSCVRWPSASEP
jgi:hypothetical protein